MALLVGGGGGGGGSSSSESAPAGGDLTVLNNAPAPVPGERVVAAAQTYGSREWPTASCCRRRARRDPAAPNVPLYMNEYVGEPAPLRKLHRIRLPFPYARDSYISSLEVSANPAPNPDKTAGVALSWFLHVGDKESLTHYFGLTRHGIDVY